MSNIKYLKLAASIVICLSAGAIGSVFTSSSVGGWYRTLAKPSFNPPAWLFAPVWTLLYITMGISLFLVWTSRNAARTRIRIALFFFSIQLLLNFLWSVFFFGLKSPLLGFIDILLLWATIMVTMLSFKKISQLSSCILVPYLLWVTFAAVLNYSILAMN